MFSTKHRTDDINIDETFDFEVALAGNPNVGKSTIFNTLTGLKQHTGNWTGKTVSNAVGYSKHKDKILKIVDLPGTYSLMSGTPEEMIAKEYIVSDTAACTVVVLDATAIERNLNLVLQILDITQKVVVCVNLLDEAKKKNIYIDLDELSLQLGVPVVGTTARSKKGIVELKNAVIGVCDSSIKTFRVASLFVGIRDNSIKAIYDKCSDIADKCISNGCSKCNCKDRKIDKILTSKTFGIPIMILLLCVLFWITITGANYPSMWLSSGFLYIKECLTVFFNYINLNATIVSFLIDGVYTTMTWVVAVMLPPMMIFFPIFSLLEDSGYLPRIAFNLDNCFKSSGADGKQALTMSMGFGCNACGVMGCRIIGSQRERNIAILTNNFMPCNGRLPSLIAISSIFVAVTTSAVLNSIINAVTLMIIIVSAVIITLLTSKFLSKTLLKGQSSSFVLELPSYRRPQVLKTIIYSIKDRALFVLMRAVTVAVPAGALIWFLANVSINGESLLSLCTKFAEPFGNLIGLDGVIVIAFILGFPANETVIPVMLMAYLSNGVLTDYSSVSELSKILISSGWTIETAICFMIMCVFHFPCSTTCLTIKKETQSTRLTLLSMVLPTAIGILLCLAVHLLFLLVSFA